jgi:DNA mismatch endonuclease (patch repair protein)
MTDIVDAETRSRWMAGIGGKHTKPERTVRGLLTLAGVRYRLHRTELPGAPDVVVPSRKAAILIHGCFWHVHEGCRYAKWPADRAEVWRSKLQRNVERDAGAAAMLNMLGWRVLVIWECSTRRVTTSLALQRAVLTWLAGDDDYGEIDQQHLLLDS